jgi:hypothetical protein
MIGWHGCHYRERGQSASVKIGGKQSTFLSDQGKVDFSFPQRSDLFPG